MSARAEIAKIKVAKSFDGIKWLFVLVVVCVGVYGNYYFADESLLYRVIGLVFLALIAAFVALKTTAGSCFSNLLRDAKAEVRRIVWPTRQETTQTTFLVVGVVLFMGVILWGVDSLLGWLVSILIG